MWAVCQSVYSGSVPSHNCMYSPWMYELHVLPVDVRPVALTHVSSATQKILAVQAGGCPQVAVALHV